MPAHPTGLYMEGSFASSAFSNAITGPGGYPMLQCPRRTVPTRHSCLHSRRTQKALEIRRLFGPFLPSTFFLAVGLTPELIVLLARRNTLE